MNKLIIGILILGSMLTVSGCASKSSQDTSNNTQTEQYEIQPDSPNNIKNNTNDNINNPTTDNKKQTTKSDTSKTDDSKKNNSNSDKSKSNDSEVNIKKEQTKNDSNNELAEADNSINKEDATDNNSKDQNTTNNSNSVKKENSTENNDINEEKSTTNTSSKKDYTNPSETNTDSTKKTSSTSNLTTSNSTGDKKTTVKPVTTPTKEQVEIAKKTSTPSKNKVVKNRVTQNNNESSSDAMQNYYGTWVISEVIGYTKISTNNTSPLNKTLVLNKNNYINNSFDSVIENPRYLITKISKTAFCNGYKLDSLQGTGLTGDTITALDINSSTNPNSDFDELYIQNGYLVYLQDGVFFKCVKQ